MTYPQNNDEFIKDNLKNYNSKKLINYILRTNIPFSDCWFFVIRENFLVSIILIFLIQDLVKVKYLLRNLYV